MRSGNHRDILRKRGYRSGYKPRAYNKVVWGDVFFFEQVGAFFSRYADLNNHQATEDEIEAGIEDLSTFPPYIGVVKTIAEQSNETRDTILEDWSADDVFMWMLHDYVQSTVQKNLEAIKRMNDKLG